jgi:lysophospholipase L1-like esterase
MRRRASILVVFAILGSSLATGVPTAQAGPADDAFYISLGDSLAVGYQPGQGETQKGYVDVLWRTVREALPTLVRQKLGCAGETSASLISGDGSPCTYPEGSQLDAAVAFIGSHAGQVPFITIDIGSNDVVEACFDFDTAQFDQSCVEDLVPELQDRVTQIVDALRAAAGPDVPILGMTYYNPFLGLWILPHGHPLARKAQRAWAVFDAGLTEAYADAGAVVVDVAATFKVEEFEDTARLNGKRVPLNVALACRWTWFCSDEAFGDPHANSTGYKKIARTFHDALEPLLA